LYENVVKLTEAETDWRCVWRWKQRANFKKPFKDRIRFRSSDRTTRQGL